MTKQLIVRLTLDVTFDLNETDPDKLHHNLRRVAERAVEEGLLSQDTEAEVNNYTVDTTTVVTYDVGDEVQLKSGGPKLTVMSVLVVDGEVYANCSWNNGGTPREQCFKTVTLKPYDPKA